MSLFNIKLKTKNGNDIKKKETFTVFFRLKYKKNTLTKRVSALYTYRIMYSKGTIDPKRVLELKDSNLVTNIEDLTLKVMLNFCHIIGKITQTENIDSDFVLFMSPDFDSKLNRSWMYLKDVFDKNSKYDDNWTDKDCKRFELKKAELDLLKDFANLNPNTKFMNIDPNRDTIKYKKSIGVCTALKERIDNYLQITKDDESSIIKQ